MRGESRAGEAGGRRRRAAAVWWRAARYHFVPPSFLPAAVGAAVAWTETGRFHAGWFVLTVLGVTANHVALNLTDDHFDYRAAVDGPDHGANPYAGGSGVLTSGALSPGQVRAAYRAGYAVTALCGGVLTWARGWPVAAFAAFGMLASYAYTAPPVRYGYRGWGEVSQLVNFSLTLGLGSYYVQAGGVSWRAAVALLPLGFLMFAMIVLNEIPDRRGDRRAGKRTLVVRLGVRRATILYGAALLAALSWLAGAVGAGWLPTAALVAVAPAPWALRAWHGAAGAAGDPAALAPAQLLTIRIHNAVGWGLLAAFTAEGIARAGAVGPAAVLLGVVGVAYLPAGMVVFGRRTT